MTDRGKKRDTVAVVIPLFNHADYIEAAITSVLEQSRPVDEIILIDDGSTDSGFEIASRILADRPDVILRTQKNSGAHVALNRGISESTSEWIAILNSDDVFAHDKIDRCLEIINSTRSIDLLFGAVQPIDSAGRVLRSGVTIDWLSRARKYLSATGFLPMALLHENFAVTTSNMFFRRDLWQRVDGFQPLRYCHDLDFLMAAFRKGNVFFDKTRDHIRYRVHESNTIKENVSGVFLEISAILLHSLRSNGTRLGTGAYDEDYVCALNELIKSKALSDCSLLLLPLLGECTNRTEFYKAVTQGPMTSSLRLAIDGKLPRPYDRPCNHDVTEDGPRNLISAPKVPSTLRSIVIEVGSFDKGGLEKVVLDTALVFKAQGIIPHIVSVGPIGHLGKLAANKGISVTRLPSTGRDIFYKMFMRARGVQLSVSHFSRVGYPLFKELGIPNITFIHNVYAMLSDVALENFISDDIYIDHYVSVSLNATRYAVERLGLNKSKVSTIPNGLIVAEHAEKLDAEPVDRATLGIEPSDYVFLNVASYNLHKAHYLMAAAMEEIRHYRSDIKIVCIGNDVYLPHGQELRTYLKNTGLDKFIILAGYKDNVAPFHKMSDAFLLPSFIEGWSIAMNEAMYYAKPMILSNTGGAGEVIENSDIGLIVPNEYGDILELDSARLDAISYTPQQYKTSSLLASAMQSFADNREHWARAGLLGQEKILRQYEFKDMVDKYIRVMRNLIEQ